MASWRALLWLSCCIHTASGQIPLRDWIQEVVVEIPAFSLLPHYVGFALSVNGGRCQRFQVGEVKALTAAGSSSELRAKFQLVGVGATCVVDTTIEVLGSARPCHVDAVVRGASFSLGVNSAVEGGLPTGSLNVDCQLSSEILDLVFNDSGAACEVLRSAEGAIRRMINSHSEVICAAVKRSVSDAFARATEVAAAAVRAHGRPVPGRPPPLGVPPSALDLEQDIWEAATGLSLRTFATQVLHAGDIARLNDALALALGRLGLLRPDGTVELPAALRSRLPSRADLPVPASNGTIMLLMDMASCTVADVTSFGLLSMAVDGPQSARVVFAAAPSAVLALNLSMRLRDGRACLQLGGLDWVVFEGAPLRDMKLTVSARAGVLGGLRLFMALSRPGLRTLQLDQMQHVGCAGQLLLGGIAGGPAQLLALQGSLAPDLARLALEGVGPRDLEWQLLNTSAQLAGAFWDAFGNTSMLVLQGLLSGEGRAFANKSLAEYLGINRSCPASDFSPGRLEAAEAPAEWLTGLVLAPALLLATSWALRRARSAPSVAGRSLGVPVPPASAATALVAEHLAKLPATGRGSDIAVASPSASTATPSALTAAGFSSGSLGECSSCVGESSAAMTASSFNGECVPFPGGGSGPLETSEAAPAVQAFLYASSGALGLPGAESASRRLAAEQLLEELTELRTSTQGALAWDPGISWTLRWGMLLGVVGNISLFVVATVTPGVSIRVAFQASREIWKSPDIAVMSLNNTVPSLLRCQAYFLALVIVLFSLIWPYAKLLLMLYAWLVPMTVCARGKLVVFLDKVGKWSLTDNFTMFLLVVLFWVRWDSSAGSAGGPAASIALDSVPDLELSVFVAATVASLLLGHAMLAVHRWRAGELKASDWDAHPDLPLRRKSTTRTMSLLTTISLLASAVLVAASWLVEIVEIRMDGLVGVFKDLSGEPRVQRYTILGIVSQLGKQGSAYLQTVLIVFVLAIPFLYLAALMVMWVTSLSRRSQLKFFTLCQALAAWSSLDVFVVAFLGAALGGQKYGIAQFVDQVINHQNVGPLCHGLRTVGIECLIVHVNPLPATWLLVAAAVTLAAVGSHVNRRATSELYDTHAPRRS